MSKAQRRQHRRNRRLAKQSKFRRQGRGKMSGSFHGHGSGIQSRTVQTIYRKAVKKVLPPIVKPNPATFSVGLVDLLDLYGLLDPT